MKLRLYEYLWLCGGVAGEAGCFKVVRVKVRTKAPHALNGPPGANTRKFTVSCSELRISVAPLDNMAGFQLTLLENIACTLLTLCENRLTLGSWPNGMKLSSHTRPYQCVACRSAGAG
jgi:hypothetical protein